MTMEHAAQTSLPSPPTGFEPVSIGGAFAIHNGPLFARWHKGQIEFGFRVGAQQVNPANNCHGGMLSLFADIPRQFLPTIGLQLDFLAPAPLGSWVQGRADILKVTRNLIFSQGLVTADGQLVLRTSGTFKRGPLLPDTDSDYRLHLPRMPTPC